MNKYVQQYYSKRGDYWERDSWTNLRKPILICFLLFCFTWFWNRPPRHLEARRASHYSCMRSKILMVLSSTCVRTARGDLCVAVWVVCVDGALICCFSDGGRFYVICVVLWVGALLMLLVISCCWYECLHCMVWRFCWVGVGW